MDKTLEINGETRKKFEEERARRILIFAFPEKYNISELSERPDILAVKSNIGVEVTNCLKKEFHQNMSKAAAISGRFEHELTSVNRKNIDTKKVFVDALPTGQYLAGFTTWGDNQDLIKTFCKKTESLNRQGFQLFHENNLFIYTWHYEEEPYFDLMEYLKKLSGTVSDLPQKFDYIYIFYEKQLLCVNLLSLEVSLIEMPKETLREISEASFLEVVGMSRDQYYGR